MHSKLDALVYQNTWSSIGKFGYANIVTYKWVFTLKYKSKGNIACHKVHLVAHDFIPSLWHGLHLDILPSHLSSMVFASTRCF